MSEHDPVEDVAHIIARLGGEFGFTHVDLYMPGGEDGELVAFTVSKSKEYVEAVSGIEIQEAK